MFSRQTLTINCAAESLKYIIGERCSNDPTNKFKAFGIVKSAYPKNFVFKVFSVHIKTQGGSFKLSSLKRMFKKSSVFGWVIMFPYELGGFVQMVEFA